ncbi:hypothetical protein [Streptomyces sp.]|uniref:hypothetical protein n=1 Tax=Streptomyces sp. TaxID=1931 RepID=UPI002F3FCD84
MKAVNRFLNGRLARRTVGAAALAALVTVPFAGTAHATGDNGWYQFCARGTYTTYAHQASYQVNATTWTTAWSTAPLRPGQCTSVHLRGYPVDIYLVYDDGGEKKIGASASYQANIAAAGYKANAYWYYY